MRDRIVQVIDSPPAGSAFAGSLLALTAEGRLFEKVYGKGSPWMRVALPAGCDPDTAPAPDPASAEVALSLAQEREGLAEKAVWGFAGYVSGLAALPAPRDVYGWQAVVAMYLDRVRDGRAAAPRSGA